MSATPNNSNSIKLIAAMWVAVGAIVLLVAVDIYLFIRLDGLQNWDKALVLHKGLEAIALAGAGFLFGREVHRERAEKAEERAYRNEQGVRDGHTLAGAVKAAAQQASATAGATPQTGLAILETLANQLFP